LSEPYGITIANLLDIVVVGVESFTQASLELKEQLLVARTVRRNSTDRQLAEKYHRRLLDGHQLAIYLSASSSAVGAVVFRVYIPT